MTDNIPLIIANENEYQHALSIIEKLIDTDPEKGTIEARLLETWGILINEYENRESPIELPDIVEAIKFRMDQMDLKQSDLIPMIGSSQAVTELLEGNLPLTLPMIKKLHTELNIPFEILIRQQTTEELEYSHS